MPQPHCVFSLRVSLRNHDTALQMFFTEEVTLLLWKTHDMQTRHVHMHLRDCFITHESSIFSVLRAPAEMGEAAEAFSSLCRVESSSRNLQCTVKNITPNLYLHTILSQKALAFPQIFGDYLQKWPHPPAVRRVWPAARRRRLAAMRARRRLCRRVFKRGALRASR